jgi:hypothetical protein
MQKENFDPKQSAETRGGFSFKLKIQALQFAERCLQFPAESR